MPERAVSGKTRPLARFFAHARTPLYRNAYALILSAGATSGLGMVYWVLAARHYPAEVVGVNSAIVSAMLFLAEISRLNLGSALLRFVPRAGHATGRFIGAVYLVSVAVAAAGCLVAMLVPAVRAAALRLLEVPPTFFLWFLLALLAWCIYTLQENVLTALGQAVWVPVENALFAVGKIGLLLILAGSFPRFGIFASWMLPAVALLVPVNVAIFGRFVPRHVREAAGRAEAIAPAQIASYVAGDYLGHVFFLASTSLLPVLVVQQAGTSANAYFYQPWLIASSLQLITYNMATSLTVEAARDPAKLPVYARQMLLHVARLLVPPVALIVLGAPVILLAFGESYAAEGTTLLRLLALSALPYLVITIYFSIARVRRQIAGIVVVQGVLCVLTLGLSYALLRLYGITGVGIAWLASCAAVAAALLLARLEPRVPRPPRGLHR